MLTRDESLASPEKFISDNLTHKPAASTSIWNNFSQGFTTAQDSLNSFNNEYIESPRGKAAAATREAIDRGNKNPEVGWTQWGANEAANLVGQALNPLTWALGEGAGLLAKPLVSAAGYIAPKGLTALMRKPITSLLAEPAAKYIPAEIGKEGAKKTLSMGLFGEELTKGFFVGAGVALPDSVLANFNAETKQHDFLGIAKGMGMGGIFGMGISTIPFAWGIAKANINRLRGKASSAPIEAGDAEQALADGLINKDTYDYWKELETYRQSPEGRAAAEEKLKSKSTKFLANKGHAVDHANDTAQFEILNRDQINNLQSATVDQLVADHIPDEHKGALTDFTVQAGIDDMRNNPAMLDGVRGYVEYADAALANSDEVLAKADSILADHIETGIPKGSVYFDQESLYKIAKEHGRESQLPFAIPSAIKERLSQESRIEALEAKNKQLFNQYEQTGNAKFSREMKANNKKLEEMRANLKPLKTPVEELKAIHEDLIENKKLKPDFKKSDSYNRLQDLAEVWHPAKTLLDRVQLEEKINEQKAYRDLAKMMLDIADSNLGKMADVSKVQGYLEARTKPRINELHEPSKSIEQVKEAHQVPADADVIIAEQDRVVEQKTGKFTKEEYSKAKEKFNEFKGSEGIFKNLINCVLGSSNG